MAVLIFCVEESFWWVLGSLELGTVLGNVGLIESPAFGLGEVALMPNGLGCAFLEFKVEEAPKILVAWAPTGGFGIAKGFAVLKLV